MIGGGAILACSALGAAPIAAVCSDMASVTEETPHAFADAIRLVIAQSGIKRQPYDAIGASIR